MDLPPLPPLPSLFDSLGQNTSLLDFTSGFHIPALEDRPQDPIIARLSSDRQKGQGNSNCVFSTVSTQDVVSNGITNQSQSSTTSRDWTQHLPLDSPLRLLAWDQSNISMKPVVEAPASLSKQTFLSQKLTTTQARPRTIVMNADAIKDFFQYLVYGTSSQIFYWVDECELFKLNPKILGLCLEGLSNRSTDLIMTRFLNIGSLLRRLEEFVLGHSSRKSRVPEIHSLVHCVSVVIAHLRRTTTKQLLSSRALVANCLQYGETESILDFLGQVCYRNLDIFPPYQSLPQSQKELLDHVYLHSAHVVHSSPLRPLKAVAAYLLTETTYGWLGSVTAALGMEGQDLGKREIAGESTPVYDLWPSFVDERSGLLIQRGIKSLQLLRSGRPSHPACTARKTNTNAPKLRWVWTQDDVQDYITSQSSRLDHLKRLVLNEQLDGNALSQTAVRNRGAFPCIHVSLIHNVHPESQSVPSSYPPTIGDMVTFDRPPTLYDDHRSKSQAVKTLETMMESFPHTLPPVTPSMDRLGNLLIVEPLVAYSRLLSKSLLDVFLNELYLLVHLDVLHRFMLFGDANFVARLRFALCDERPFSDQSTDSSKDDNPTAAQSLGLGLNVRLSPTGDWPPSGFGLSHSLRSIIVEVLKASGTANSDMPGRESVIKEAEWRMGFVVPPADDDDEKARCHPFGLHALSFLRLQYRPPDSLTSFLNPEVMEKYQRIFNFLLELLRVDSILRSCFYTTFRGQRAPTEQSWSRPTVLLIRRMQLFFNGFLGYVFDAAISANWTRFIDWLSKRSRVPFSGWSLHERPDWDDEEWPASLEDDVFAVMQSHSDTLDEILKACFLKGRQRAARSALQKPLLLILQVGSVLQNSGDTAKESEGKLLDIGSQWNEVMHNLTKVFGSRDKLRNYRPMGNRNSAPSQESYSEELLLRVDLNGWYSRKERISSVKGVVPSDV